MLNKTKCRLGANREALEKMTPSTSLIIPNKWTSQLQCWMTNESKLTVCKNRGRVFWRSSYSILWVYRSNAYHYLLALVALISRWIQNFGETVGLTFSAFHDWSSEQFKAFLCRLRSVANRMQVITNKIHHNTLINGMRLFLQRIRQIQSKIVYFYSVINEYHSAVEMFTPRHLDTNDQILNTAHDAQRS